MTLLVGDRVYRNGSKNFTGTVIKVDEDDYYPILVNWDDHIYNVCYLGRELSLIGEPPIIDVDILFKDIEL
jgi:hypothetical protein